MNGRQEMASEPVKAAIFDIGATLVTGPPVAPNKAIAGLLRGVSAAEVASVIMTRPFASVTALYEALESRFGPIDESAREGIAQLWDAQASAARELDGAGDTVREIKTGGIKIGLLSDIWSPYYRSVEAAIPDVIAAADSIVLSFRTGRRKPDPTGFLMALNELRVRPEEAVMVGDTYEHDILPAIELGMKTVWVLARPDREAESIIKVGNGEAPEPTWAVQSIRDVPPLNSQLSTLKGS